VTFAARDAVLSGRPGGYGWDRRGYGRDRRDGSVPVSPLVAAALAHWGRWPTVDGRGNRSGSGSSANR
jgi:hypothetical protein